MTRAIESAIKSQFLDDQQYSLNLSYRLKHLWQYKISKIRKKPSKHNGCLKPGNTIRNHRKINVIYGQLKIYRFLDQKGSFDLKYFTCAN